MSDAQTSAKANVETWGALINGEFRPAVNGKTFPTFNPGNGEIIAYLAECDEEDIDLAVRAALAAYPAWKKKTGAARAKLLMKLAQLVEANGPKLAELEVAQRRQADPRFQGDRRGDRDRRAGIFRRHGDQDPGRHHPSAGPLHQHDAARAARRHRRHHPVELSAAAGGVEDRARDRRRQHGRRKAGRAGLPLGDVVRQAVHGGGHSGGRRQHRARLRRGRRRMRWSITTWSPR